MSSKAEEEVDDPKMTGVFVSFQNSEPMSPVSEREDILGDESSPRASMARRVSKSHIEVHEHKYGFWERQAVRVAKYPKVHFWTAFLLSAILGILGMTLSPLESADHKGWHARGTEIGNRHSQLLLVRRNAEELLYDDDNRQGVWDDLLTNVQPGWENDNTVGGGRKDYRRSLKLLSEEEEEQPQDIRAAMPQAAWARKLTRQLQEEPSTLSDKLATCEIDWYSDGTMYNQTRLWPVWKAKELKSGSSFLNPQLLQDLCQSEANTQRFLEENGYCTGCSQPNQCLPPFSLVLFARFNVKGGMDMTCIELADAWQQLELTTQTEFQRCAQDLNASSLSLDQLEDQGLPDSCPFGFDPSFADEGVASGGQVHYTSSIFFTTEEGIPELYQQSHRLDKGTDTIQGAYDTQWQDFVNILAEKSVNSDMILATASAIITTLAMLVHTRSPFLTLGGILQIGLSFPLAFFVYTYICKLAFFPFLNFIGVFVVFALGADDVFVAVDKWKNFRNAHPKASTEHVAANALPDAAYAMLLTTSTTSVAFFGTAICPVAPIRVFAIFSGLLIFIDYIMVLVILFPCLCIYDGYRDVPRNKWSFLLSFDWPCQHAAAAVLLKDCDSAKAGTMDSDSSLESPPGTPKKDTSHKISTNTNTNKMEATTTDLVPAEEQEDASHSLIRCILLAYSKFIHTIRWPLLAACLAAFAVSTIFAAKMDLPESSEVRILKPDVEYEKAFAWRMKLLSTALLRKGGSKAYVIWGVEPADTGNHNDPNEWTQMKLDETFDPSSQEAQVYMRDFCSYSSDWGFFNQSFAIVPETDFVCPINRFDEWLQTEANRSYPSSVWADHCEEAAGLPMDSEAFHPCLTAWAQMEHETMILTHKGKVQVIFFPFTSRVRYDSTNDQLKNEWYLINGWMTDTQAEAPPEVSRAFFSSPDFWYFDTTTQMYKTAYGSIAIALIAAATVIFVSSKSLIMTLYSVISVAYVLMSVISMTYAVGWDLGFLESICFAIAIGISVDFVIHFSHAYTTPKGKVDKEKRTEYALISMGPSILAAAFTTIAGATIMFFTTIQFFGMFALVLFLTIIQATIGSFVFFLTITNCVGPSQPTYFADEIARKFGNGDNKEEEPRSRSHTYEGSEKSEAIAPKGPVASSEPAEADITMGEPGITLQDWDEEISV